ncbi:MAG: hypothetical protein ACFFCQ_08545 [Promethearchaeota archaeon]
MIWRRREGEIVRSGLSWQYDKVREGFWAGLHLVIPYWLTEYKYLRNWMWKDKYETVSQIKRLHISVAITYRYVAKKPKLHFYFGRYASTWSKFKFTPSMSEWASKTIPHVIRRMKNE